MRLPALFLAAVAVTGVHAAPHGRGSKQLDNFICDAALGILSAAAQPSQIAAASSYCSSLIRPTVKAVTTTTPAVTVTETTTTNYIATTDIPIRRSSSGSGRPPPAWQHYLSQDLSSICTCLLTKALPQPTTVFTSTQTLAPSTTTATPVATETAHPLYFVLQVKDSSGNLIGMEGATGALAGPVMGSGGGLIPYPNGAPLQFVLDPTTLGQPGTDIKVQANISAAAADDYPNGYPFLAAAYNLPAALAPGHIDTSYTFTENGGNNLYTTNWAILTLATNSIGANQPASNQGVTYEQSVGLGDVYGNYETTIWQVSNDGKYSLSGVWTNPDQTTVDVNFFQYDIGPIAIIGDVVTLNDINSNSDGGLQVFLNFVPVYA